MILMAMVEAPVILKYLTRFTEEIYTGLICAIFLYEASLFVYDEFLAHSLKNLNQYCNGPEPMFPNTSRMLNTTFAGWFQEA